MGYIDSARRAALLGAVTAAVALGGCGGSSSNNSKAAFIDKVNGICANLKTQGKAIRVPSDFTTNPTAAAAYLDKLNKVGVDAYGKLNAVKPPASLATGYRQYIGKLSYDLALLKTAEADAHAKNSAGLTVLNQEEQHTKNVTRPQARQLGLTGCV
jgi:hypothetical protein